MTVPITPLRPEECRPVPDAGLGALETEKGNLPLESVDVAAHVTGLVAGVEVVQTFRNAFDVSLEATYVFPLPPRAAVTAFRMKADDRVVDGVLKERGQARADYDRALAEGRRAAIAEEDRPDVFTIRVGNIVPGERVVVRLTLSQPLPYEDGAAEFRFPLVVAPRYIPGAPLPGPPAGGGVAPDTDAAPDASRITPPVLLPGFPYPVRLSLAATIDPAGLGLREVRSSLHEVDREGDTIRLRPGERLDRDFILRLAFDASSSLALVPDDAADAGSPGEGTADSSGSGSGPAEGTAQGTVKDVAGAEGTFVLTLLPPQEDATRTAPRDVVLLLDRSGSMTGWKMVAARRAAARIVDTLTRHDRFAVLSFDSVVERAFSGGLVDAGDRNRYRAVEHLSRLDARGGTEMLAPLQEALRLLDGHDVPAPGAATGTVSGRWREDDRPGESGLSREQARDRVLVLVTDGQVGNEDEILERIGARLHGVRVHTVGIDRAVNAGFLGRLALLGSGRCELVESEDRLDAAMEHIHRRIGSPLVTDVALKAEGMDLVADTVTHAGSLYPGVPLVVSGRYRGRRPAVALTVQGRTADGRPWEERIEGRPAHGPAARAVWARAHLRGLEDRYAMGDHSLEQRIVDTSLRFGVLCRFTAFVAVDTRVTGEGGPEHRVIQPVEPPSGWEMPTAMPMMAAGAPMMAKMAAFTTTGPEAPSGSAADRPIAAAPPPGAPPAMPPAPPYAAAPAPAPRRASRGFSIGRFLPHPGAGTAPATGFEGVKPLLAEELMKLVQAESLPERERRRYLADLASRLRVVAQMVGGHPDLAALAADLERAEWAEVSLDDLWRRTADLLTALTGSSGSASAGSTSPGSPGSAPGAEEGRRPFWKRS
ncbi:VIT domain-containing protein [Microbispora catharanthi]|uniref:VWA domain-containing protein n=1 Tax=Microbispora catharanthi TaxID=1712871 RepID=A0A5N6BNQ8_9ACTN|nr:VIT domain-containing protein [Microbispora catharanthi]KAB8181489.1 VWA domain-containing protein [Microbispora catharanthi]